MITTLALLGFAGLATMITTLALLGFAGLALTARIPTWHRLLLTLDWHRARDRHPAEEAAIIRARTHLRRESNQ